MFSVSSIGIVILRWSQLPVLSPVHTAPVSKKVSNLYSALTVKKDYSTQSVVKLAIESQITSFEILNALVILC